MSCVKKQQRGNLRAYFAMKLSSIKDPLKQDGNIDLDFIYSKFDVLRKRHATISSLVGEIFTEVEVRCA